MKIPTFIFQQIVQPATGEPTPSTQQFFDVLVQQMQMSLSDDGWVLPSQTVANIRNIISGSNPNSKGPGTIWYATDINKFVGNQGGILVSFNTTPV